MNYRFLSGLSALGIFTASVPALVAPAANAAGLSTAEIAQKAIATTVQINNPAGGGGSGVIIGKNGNEYTVLTANHVINSAGAQYVIVTPDGNTHTITRVQSFQQSANSPDLALVFFESASGYSVATLGNSEQANTGADIYVSGFPAPGLGATERNHEFTNGIITSRPTDRPQGYTMRYNAVTRMGMSGGPVFDAAGLVIGIHGQGDTAGNVESSNRTSVAIKTGFNAAIPIATFLNTATSSGVNSSSFKVDTKTLIQNLYSASNPVTARDFYVRGLTHAEKREWAEAEKDFNQVITLDPDFIDAYAKRSESRLSQVFTINRRNEARGDDVVVVNSVIADLDRVIALEPNNHSLYVTRGWAHSLIRKNRDLAIQDYNRAIELAPEDSENYGARCYGYLLTKKYREAFEDCNKAIKMGIEDKSSLSDTYGNRAFARHHLGDTPGSLVDVSRSIELTPNNIKAYMNRAFYRQQMGDKVGSQEDLARAASIALEEGDTEAYEAVRSAARTYRLLSDCYIATAVLTGDGSEAQLNLLRGWRDGVLLKTRIGQALVAHYRNVGPLVALNLPHHPVVSAILVKSFISPAVNLIQTRQELPQVEKLLDPLIYGCFLSVLTAGTVLHHLFRRFGVTTAVELF
jgi:serine protease Do